MAILVVGSVAYDTVETPAGRRERVLGGSASYFAVAASFFAPVNLVGVVGSDFGEPQLAAFRGRPIDLAGLQRVEGKTFHWEGRYTQDLNARDTISTELNVFERFEPKIPEPYRRSELVFLGNIHPSLQRSVLGQVERPRLVACDTMNYWITRTPQELRQTLRQVDVLLINDQESRELSGEWNLVKAAEAVRAMGPLTLVVKKGEHGVMLFTGDGCFAAPALPLAAVVDPTGAGDTFAGGFVGYLASRPNLDDATLRQAVVMGSTLASFCVEAFSLDRLLSLTREEIAARFALFEKLTRFDSLD